MERLISPHFDENHLNLLVAEDSQDLRELIGDLLGLENIGVHFAMDGEEAILMASKTSYDVILMDLTLPKVSGQDAMKAIKTLGILTPILAFTACSDVKQKDHCLEI